MAQQIDPSSEAMGAWPQKVEQCNVPQPFCTFQFNRKIVQPYNFMMPQWAWELVEKRNKLEFLLAVRYGMEFDLNQINDALLHRPSFHTVKYVEFQYYLKKHALKEIAVLMAEFESKNFSIRFKTSFSVLDLVSLKGTIDTLNPTELVKNATELARNNYNGTVINRQLFKQIFNQDYDPQALKLLASDRRYPDTNTGSRNW
ncbi:hypothetical protein MN869_11895 [Acinetobacter sp. NIPH1876]|uniref:hypothetical protein n=1 Tax=Acinetobacter sp. NIPH1876 TaxID=2924041 RepID=UPI001FACDB2C|nr:hypothetical protein [Acinetobacter sp. NIPH1876]MCJ0829144.1 hypothetical protein [Acinetobacter sp. NIPH1876]